MARALRLLVVAPAVADGRPLREEVKRRAGDRGAEVQLVVPAVTASKVKHAFGDVDDAIVDAERRLQEAVRGLQGDDVRASASIGDSDPLVAAEDALGGFPADEILIVTQPGEEAEWFEEDLFDRAAERFVPPVIHVEIGANGDRQPDEVERSGRGLSRRQQADADEVELYEGMPPFSRRDLASITVAIAGTIALALLAANPPGGTDSFGGAARILIAMAFALINLAHVVGLVFFNSQGYRGPGRTLFGNLSLFGTPLAILVSALL